MASTYVNNLRLEEIATGEQSGTWGNTTNTNLEIIGQVTAWGTRAIANASTDNITIADGALDADRSLVLKLTGGGQACTVTLLPNTSSKTWVMYNTTSATLTFTCGSGANVAVPAGESKIIATDGLGSGGVVHDVLTGVNLTGNAATATALQTARTIAGVSFDGSANISLNNNAITNGAGYTTSVGDITGVTAGTGISGGGTSGDVTITNSSPNATHTGEVTGATALTIADNVVDEANLKVSNAPTNGYMLTAQSGNTGGLTWAAAASGGGGMVWSVKTTTYTAATDEAIIANTSGGIWTLTLPATPVVGDVVRVADGASWETNNLTVARNGSTIEGVAQDVTMDINSASVDFVYNGTTWLVYVMMGTELVDYLPLAGGTLTGDLQVKGVQETVFALSGTTPAIDPTAGTIATWTLSGASTPTFGAGWAEGESILLMIDDGAGNTITWPTMQWAGGTEPTLPTTGYAVVTLFKVGATFYGTSAGDMS